MLNAKHAIETILGFNHSILLVYDAPSLGNWVQSFRGNTFLVLSSSRAFSGLQFLENEGTKFTRNTKKPNYSLTRPRIPE